MCIFNHTWESPLTRQMVKIWGNCNAIFHGLVAGRKCHITISYDCWGLKCIYICQAKWQNLGSWNFGSKVGAYGWYIWLLVPKSTKIEIYILGKPIKLKFLNLEWGSLMGCGKFVPKVFWKFYWYKMVLEIYTKSRTKLYKIW